MKQYKVWFRPLVLGLIVEAETVDQAEQKAVDIWIEMKMTPVVTRIEEIQETEGETNGTPV